MDSHSQAGAAEKPARYVGCCGCYCKTCKEYVGGHCKGCKLGYDTGERQIGRAKCQMKLCCFRDRGLETCADCPDYSSCDKLDQKFKGYPLRKCRAIIAFIQEHGYPRFFVVADKWKNHYGKLP